MSPQMPHDDFETVLQTMTMSSLPDDDGRTRFLDVLRQLRTTPPPQDLEGAAVLLLKRGETPRWIPLSEQLRIGRHSSMDVTIRQEWVSNVHCLLRHDEQTWLLKDQGSTNGTLLNGKRTDTAPLKLGDVIQIGSTRLIFHDASTEK